VTMWKVESIQKTLFGQALVHLTANWDPNTHETLPMDSDELDRQDVRVGDMVSLLYWGGCWRAKKEAWA